MMADAVVSSVGMAIAFAVFLFLVHDLRKREQYIKKLYEDLEAYKKDFLSNS